MSVDACGFWNNEGCEGTVHCPPRCPRFVDREGTPYLVLPMEEGDVDAVVAMYRAFAPEYRSMGLPPIGETELRAWLGRLHDRGRNFLAWDGDRVVGHAGFSATHHAEPEFLVYVHQDYHGRGLGSELTRQAIAHAAADGHDALTLHVDASNEAALSVYRKLGFETVRRHALELEMRLPLASPTAEATRLAPGAEA